MTSATPYDRAFYLNRRELTRQSTDIILSLLWPIVRPASVLDLGCATGSWLHTCSELGCDDYLGLDGPWVDQTLLEIPVERFQVHDFSVEDYSPERRYDLALSIEVAEHLDEGRGAALVSALVGASDVVLFSAAVEGQGGDGHINEQPQSYWAKVFAARGYRPVDLVRPAIWDNPDVNVIYKQNLLLYANEVGLRRLVGPTPVISDRFELERVHPDLLKLVAGTPVRGRAHGVMRGMNQVYRSLLGKAD